MHTVVIAALAAVVGAILGFVLAKRASAWCPGCGGPTPPSAGSSPRPR